MSDVLLVHISDLHIGDDAVPSPIPTRMVLPHQEGHDPRLGSGLERAFMRIREELGVPLETPVHVVVSGDLTCRGSKADHASAAAFLLQRLHWPGYRQPFGLQLGAGHSFEKPGNHDHFDGGVFLPAHNPKLDKYYPWPPDPHPPVLSPGKEFEVRLYGLDSNSGLAGKVNFSLSQNGDVHQNDLDDLRVQLEEDQDDPGHPVVRILVVHHTLAFRRQAVTFAPGTWPALLTRGFCLPPGMRKRILRLCVDYRVAAILTGHTHDTERRSYPVRTVGGLAPVRELRAASAIQKRPRKAQQSLKNGDPCQRAWLVHRLNRGADGVIRWEAWPMNWSTAGFVRPEKPLFRFQVP